MRVTKGNKKVMTTRQKQFWPYKQRCSYSNQGPAGGGQIMPNTLFIGRLKVASLGLTIIKSIGNFHLTLKTASKIWMSLCMGSVQNSLQ